METEVIKMTEKPAWRLKGEIFIKLGASNREECIVNPDRHFNNIIVDVCSNLIASWAFTGTVATVGNHIKGIMTLAVGTGVIGWDLQNPPAETAAQSLLNVELARNPFASKTYVTVGGLPSATRTNIIDLTTTYLEAEAVGPLVEMGLFGGNYHNDDGTGPDSTATNGGTMINFKTFKVINKSNTSKLTVVWRLSF